MKRIRFFLDYGVCFWPVDSDYNQSQLAGHLNSLLSPQTREFLSAFLSKYGQSYSWGLPPSLDWSVEDCQIFNQQCKILLHMIQEEIKGDFVICVEQLDLTEDPEVLSKFYSQGSRFVIDRVQFYYQVPLSEIS